MVRAELASNPSHVRRVYAPLTINVNRIELTKLETVKSSVSRVNRDEPKVTQTTILSIARPRLKSPGPPVAMFAVALPVDPQDQSFNRENALYLAHASDVAYHRAPAAAALERGRRKAGV